MKPKHLVIPIDWSCKLFWQKKTTTTTTTKPNSRLFFG